MRAFVTSPRAARRVAARAVVVLAAATLVGCGGDDGTPDAGPTPTADAATDASGSKAPSRTARAATPPAPGTCRPVSSGPTTATVRWQAGDVRRYALETSMSVGVGDPIEGAGRVEVRVQRRTSDGWRVRWTFSDMTSSTPGAADDPASGDDPDDAGGSYLVKAGDQRIEIGTDRHGAMTGITGGLDALRRAHAKAVRDAFGEGKGAGDLSAEDRAEIDRVATQASAAPVVETEARASVEPFTRAYLGRLDRLTDRASDVEVATMFGGPVHARREVRIVERRDPGGCLVVQVTDRLDPESMSAAMLEHFRAAGQSPSDDDVMGTTTQRGRYTIDPTTGWLVRAAVSFTGTDDDGTLTMRSVLTAR
ncbi:MAG: hypothetical protein AB7G37_08060 [Solirubrobacteraceae bacterium]